MGNVFANGLEVSGKVSGGKTIAAMPDVCFTPPENPATPPGVPVPYPSFGMGDDTESGTATVLIGGKTVNIKNKSDLSKTSGTEAGAAAKKGIITSKNTGKAYFASWSSDVKFDGEPVIRMSDLSTHNHGSGANAPPWAHVLEVNGQPTDCALTLKKFGMTVHPYKQADKHCNSKQQSDHIVQNACFMNSRNAPGGISTVPSYKIGEAPCVCLNDATDTKTEHGRKTLAQNDWTSDQKTKSGNPTYEQVRDGNLEAMKKAKPAIADKPPGTESEAIKCLRLVCDAFFLPKMDPATGKDTQLRCPRSGAFTPSTPTTSVTV